MPVTRVHFHFRPSVSVSFYFVSNIGRFVVYTIPLVLTLLFTIYVSIFYIIGLSTIYVLFSLQFFVFDIGACLIFY